MLRSLSLTVILIALIGTQSGCLLVAAGAGAGAGVAYVKGDLDATVNAAPDQVAAAAEAAMKDMGLAVVSSQASKLDAKVVGRTARDTKLQVIVKAESTGTSKVSIRAGHFGDDALQSQLLGEIQKRLGLAAPAPNEPAVTDLK
jgi:hypothetical protein